MLEEMVVVEPLSTSCERAVEQFTRAHEQSRFAERAAQLNLCLYIAFFGWLAHGSFLLLTDNLGLALIQGCCSLATAYAWWLLRTKKSLVASAWIVALTVSIGVGVTAEFTNRFGSISIWFLSTSLLVAIPFVKARQLQTMAALPLGCILIMGVMEFFVPPLGTQELPDAHYFFSQVQMVVLYAYLSRYATKLAERETLALAQQEEKWADEKERAELVSRNKTRFLAKMSHELRTPMNGLLGMVQHLEAQSLDAESQAYLTRLRKRSEHILEHIDDALDLTQVDSGDRERREANFDLEHLISRVCDVQTQFGTLMSCKLDVALETNNRDYVGDHRRLRHLMSSLIGTAVRQSVNGKVQLRVFSSETDNAPEGIRDQIEFEARYQRKPTASKPLSLENSSRDLTLTNTSVGMDASSGSILSDTVDLSSKFGSSFRMSELLGGSFYIAHEEDAVVRARASIPLTRSFAPQRRTQNSLADFRKKRSSRRYRTLVVDDNPINRRVACLLLKRLGCESDTANDGVEAVELASRGSYDAIFMDLRMPNMDGFQATKEILARRAKPDQGCPIMALTANAFEEDIRRVHEAGMVAHISKPVTLEKLGEVLERYVPGHRLESPPVQQATGS